MENMDIYNKVREVPKEALKEIKAGRLKGFSDINPMWRIKMLTETFGMCGIGWRIEIVDRRIVQADGVEQVCFVDINLFVKVDGEWSYPIFGTGGSSFVTQERNGVHTSDECFKMAYTDAIGIACKSLGMAADVYYEKDRTKFNANENETEQPQQVEVDNNLVEAKAKWLAMGRTEKGFNTFVEGQHKQNKSNKAINEFVTNLFKKQQEEKKDE